MPHDQQFPPPALSAVRLAAVEREAVVQRLSDAFSQDVIPVDEFERRVEAVYRASLRSDLEALNLDLPAAVSGRQRAAAPDTGPSSSRKVSALFCNVERASVAEATAHLVLRAFAGNIELDLARAQFAHGVTEIAIHATMGNIELRLPSHVSVENEGQALLGSFEYLAVGTSHA